MEGVARHAVTDHLGIDLGVAVLGVLVLLEHQDAGALAHHKTVAGLVPGTGGARRVVVEAGRQGAGRREAGEAETADRRLGAAAHHDIGVVQHDEARRVADRMRAGRAGGHDGVVRPLEAVADRDVAGSEVDQAGRDEEWRDAARAALREQKGAVGDAGQSANTGADHDAGALAFLFVGRVPAGIVDGLRGGPHRKDDELVHAALVLWRDPIIGVEQARGFVAARHLPRDARGQVRHIEGLDRADPRYAGQEAAPYLIEPDAERRHEPHAGDDDAPHAGPNPAGLATVASNNTISYAPR